MRPSPEPLQHHGRPRHVRSILEAPVKALPGAERSHARDRDRRGRATPRSAARSPHPARARIAPLARRARQPKDDAAPIGDGPTADGRRFGIRPEHFRRGSRAGSTREEGPERARAHAEARPLWASASAEAASFAPEARGARPGELDAAGRLPHASGSLDALPERGATPGARRYSAAVALFGFSVLTVASGEAPAAVALAAPAVSYLRGRGFTRLTSTSSVTWTDLPRSG